MSNQEVMPVAVPSSVMPKRAGVRFYLRNWPFRAKLALSAIALSIVPATLVLLLLTWQAGRAADNMRRTAAQTRIHTAAALVGNMLDTDVRLVQSLAAAGSAVQPGSTSTARIAPLLFALGASAVYVSDPSGMVTFTTGSSRPQYAAGSASAMHQALTTHAPVAVLLPSQGSTGDSLVIAAPIMQGSTVTGVVRSEFDPAGLYDALTASGSTLVLADGQTLDGHAPIRVSLQLLGGTPGRPQAAAAAPALAALLSSGPLALADGSWAERVAPGIPLVMLAPPLPGSEPLLSEGLLQIVLVLLALLTLAIAVQVTMRLARPLTLLARTLASVRAGNYGARVELERSDEFGQIAGTVDMLIARTQTLITDLENQRVELENGIIQLFTELAEAASGDLTVRPTLSEGSLGAVADSVGILLERFNGTVRRIQTTADEVRAGTSQMAGTVLRVSQESQRQAAQLASGARAIADMATSARAVSQRTQAATSVAAQAVGAVDSGNKAVTYARDAAKRTGDTSKKAARQVKSLGESAQLMGNALLLVQRNTEELHLIAGNASIEAARYAENGGVFRTVADSIEQLAQQSQVALRQIQSVVENTQRETARVVGAIEDVTAEVSNVTKAVNLAGENFDTINHVVQRLADLNVFIASASEQQAGMAADVAEMIGTLNEVSVQTSRNTAASAEAAVRLRNLTEQLNDSVSTLKVS